MRTQRSRARHTVVRLAFLLLAVLLTAAPPGGRAATARAARQQSVHRAPYYGRTLAVGDSVMLDAEEALQARGISVDAAVSRQFFQGIDILLWERGIGHLPPAIVVGLGTNGPITDQLFDQMMQVVRGAHVVVFVTVREPRFWESQVNGVLRAGVARWPHTQLADWHALSAGHAEWFWDDGIHLRPEGSAPYARLVAAALSRGWSMPSPPRLEARGRRR